MSDTEFDAQDEPAVLEIATPPDSAGERADRALSRLIADLSRTRLKALIEAGCVSVAPPGGGLRPLTDPTASLPVGGVAFVTVPPPTHADPAPEDIPLSILFEDDSLVVVDKPAGMVVHPAPGAISGTLVNALLAHCGDTLSGVGGVRRPGIVHRIDKDTSGLLVAAKTDRAHVGLSAQFARRAIRRSYVAVVHGVPAPARGTIDAPIGRNARDRKKMAVAANGKPSTTHYRVIEGLGSPSAIPVASVVECELETGRTHQIRVHMTHIGHPLVGDPTYGRAPKSAPRAAARFPRQALHARTLGFSHPVTDACLSFTGIVPDDMQDLIDSLSGK